jgi:hypothetical protein
LVRDCLVAELVGREENGMCDVPHVGLVTEIFVVA